MTAASPQLEGGGRGGRKGVGGQRGGERREEGLFIAVSYCTDGALGAHNSSPS